MVLLLLSLLLHLVVLYRAAVFVLVDFAPRVAQTSLHVEQQIDESMTDGADDDHSAGASSVGAVYAVVG